jgi:hypothetical protein
LNIIKKSRFIAHIILCLTAGFAASAQESVPTPFEKLITKADSLDSSLRILQRLKITGYVQAQYQYAQADADGISFKQHGKANAYEKSHNTDYSRFAIRRGRLKFVYEEGIASAVAQVDITDKGLSTKDIYLQVKDPISGRNMLKAGMFYRPFGHEFMLSSSRRESPERTRISQIMFPDELDLGFMLTLQPPKNSALAALRLDAGWFTGNGIRPQVVSRMDFVAHLYGSHTFGNSISIGGGISAYLGGVFQNDSSIFMMDNGKFMLHDKNANRIGRYAPRQYFGADFQYAQFTAAGLTQIRLEYVAGKHPGNAAGAYDYRFSALPAAGEIYLRPIAGGYISVAQDLGPVPLTAVARYDFFDPNTDVSSNNIGADGSRTGAGDVAMHSLGCGLLWKINQTLRLTAYYELVKNETTAQIPSVASENGSTYIAGYDSDRRDNVFTLRLQYTF